MSIRAVRSGVARVLTACALVVAGSSAALAQGSAAPACAETWIGHEAEFEAAMRDGKVAKTEVVPIGVTKPQRAIMADPTPVASFAWKPLQPGYRNGFMESYKAEVAAYVLDKALNLHMVPPVVERKVDGLSGAAVYWVNGVKGWDKDHPPQGPEPNWSKQLTRMKMFDLLIGNIDRNQGNILYDADWHVILIDHSRAFIGKKDLKGIAPLVRVDRALWTQMQAMTEESLKATLGQWVGNGELRAMIARRDAMAKEIQKLVAERGEGNVFFE